jgi:thiamine-phosphate pyrophosphorylase
VAAKSEGRNNLAQAIGADGVHLPEWRVRHGAWPGFRGRKPRWLITAAAHSLAAMRRAALRGADAVLLSPVFATASHDGVRPLGALRFAAWAQKSRIPVYALGGVDVRSAARLRQTRACGLAGIGGLAVDRGARRG